MGKEVLSEEKLLCECGGKLQRLAVDGGLVLPAHFADALPRGSGSAERPYQCTKCGKLHSLEEVLRRVLDQHSSEVTQPSEDVEEVVASSFDSTTTKTKHHCRVCNASIHRVETRHLPRFDSTTLIPGQPRTGWTETTYHCSQCGIAYAFPPKEEAKKTT